MPSLSALHDFRASFNDIADERRNVKVSGLPFEEMTLPTVEPPPFNPELRAVTSDSPFDDFPGSGADPDFNLNEFLPGDVTPPVMDDFLSSLGIGQADPSPTDDFFNNLVGGQTDAPPLDDFLSSLGMGQADPPPTDDFLGSLGGGQQDSPAADDFLGSLGGDQADSPATDDFMSSLGGGQQDSSATDDFLNSLGGGQQDAPAADDFLSSLGGGQQDSPTTDDFLDSLGGDQADSPAADDFLSSLGGGQQDSPTTDDFLDSLGSDQADSPAADDFLNSLGGDQADSSTTDDFLSSLGGDQADSSATDDFLGGFDDEQEGSPPADLLSGFSDEMESSPEDGPTEETDSSGVIDLGGELLHEEMFETESSGTAGESPMDDFGFPSMDLSDSTGDESGFESSDDAADTDDSLDGSSIDLGGEILESPEEPETQSDDNDDFSDESFSNESFSDENFTNDSFTDESFSDESFSDESFSNENFTNDNFSDDSFTNDSFSEEAPFSQENDFSSDNNLPDTDFSGIDFNTGGGETDTPQENESYEDFGSDFASDSLDLDTGESSPEIHTDASIDFEIPGLENIFEKTKTESFVEPPPKKKLFGRRKAKKEISEEEDEPVEEIALKEDDVEKLMKTLSLYPLNLRIICQELIAEQVILPQQLSKLIRLLVNGAHASETAAHCEQITGKQIIIPRSWEKSTGAAFEAEQSSFGYIFVHNFLPVLRIFAVIAALAASVFYLSYKFIYVPIHAESIYARGYERISVGEYQRANDLFQQAFDMHKKKKWFYSYAEAFREQRRYQLAEGKYEELLRHYPLDKKGVLDYAHLNTYYLLNYEKANNILNINLINFSPNDYEGLLASGDNFMEWADSDPSRFYNRYEDARFAYARLLELRGWQVPLVERMLKYFIATDNLREVINLRVWFESSNRRNLTTETLAQLGGYLLDKQLEQPTGLPNPYVESIESVRAMLLQAVRERPEMPEPHYHLARYYHSLGNTREERLTLENAIRAFELARTESVPQRLMHVDTRFRYSNMLIDNREFFPAEEQLVKAIELYEEFSTRNLIRTTPQLGELYASIGDLEYYTKTGDRTAASNALNNYQTAERHGYAPPEMHYRMGSAYYQLEDWGNSLNYLFMAAAELPFNRRLLYALGNVTYQRGDYFAAQSYFDRLLDMLDYQRIRLPVLLPNDSVQYLELGERLMMAYNNAGVVYEALAEQTGNREYRSRAMALYSESARAWDSITRDPVTMTRMRLDDVPGAPGINLGYLNANNALRPVSAYRPEIFTRIDRDVLEPSRWEQLGPYAGF